MILRGSTFLACLWLGSVVAATPPTTPPVAEAFELSSAPDIDGQVLGDDAWSGVKVASGFWQVRPVAGQPASQRTEVFIGYTDDSLYIGIVAYDDNPGAIIVSDSRRDSSLEDTDSFQVILDGFQDRQNGLVFGTNAAGIEYDGQVIKEAASNFGSGSGGFNLDWDTTWRVEAAISDIGWSAEMEIPFRSLRYADFERPVWGINFQRNIRRNNEIVYWSPLERQYNLYRISDAGSLEGLRLPAQRNLKFTPYALARAQRGGTVDGTQMAEDFGFDLKYSISPSLTLDATYNTDFAQVEADDQQINLDRFSLFFPEKRPFFLENAGQFAVGNPQEVELFFSRRIGIGENGELIPIDGGLRLSGKIGNTTNVGLLHMTSESVAGIASGNDYTVARVNQELPNRSSIGAMIVNRNGDGSLLGNGGDDENQTYALDGRWGVGEHLSLEGWVAKTQTPGLSGNDDAFALKSLFDSGTWLSRLTYTEVGGEFNPEVGFLARNNFRSVEAFALRRYRPNDLWGLHEIRPHASYTGFWDFDGFQETGILHLDTHWEWNSGWEIRTEVNLTREGLKEPFEIVDGVFVQPGTYDHTVGSAAVITDQAAPLSFSMRVVTGGFLGGDRFRLTPTLNYRIGEKFSTEFSIIHNEIDLPVPGGDFNVTLTRLRLSYFFTPKIGIQSLLQHSERENRLATNLRFSWQQSANAGLYLVYNEVDEEGTGLPRGREVILKYSRIFDLLN